MADSLLNSLDDVFDKRGGLIYNGHLYDVANHLADLYVSYRGKYVLSMPGKPMFIPKKEGKPIRLDNRRICGHLGRHYAISVYAGQYASRFICFDVDEGGKGAVEQVVRQLVNAGIAKEYINVSFSGRKGWHVDICFGELVYTRRQKKLYDWVIWKAGLNPAQVEFRPTSNQAIKLPLSVHGETGNVCWYADTDTLELIENIEHVFDIRQMPAEEFNTIADALDAVKTQKPVRRKTASKKDDSTDKHEIETWSGDLPDLEVPGTRHDVMLSIAIGCLNEGHSRASAENILTNWYYDQMSKHPQFITSKEGDVLTDIQQILSWVYQEGFHLVRRTHSREPVIFTPQDIAALFELPRGLVRKAYFFLMGWCKCYGYCKVAVSRLGRMISATPRRTQQCLKILLERGRILYSRGRVIPGDSGCRQEINSYFLSAYKPICDTTSSDCASIEITAEELNDPDGFKRIYWNTICALVPAAELDKYLSPRERKECKETIEGERQDEQGNSWCG